MTALPSIPGSYTVGFQLNTRKVVTVGSLGECQFFPGYYLYCGSAMGPGGIRARLKHHYLPKRNIHWHIDYLLDNESIVSAWYLEGESPQECTWAINLNQKHNFSSPIMSFGSSDCQAGCPSHLLLLPDGHDIKDIGRLLSLISSKQVIQILKEEFRSEF